MKRLLIGAFAAVAFATLLGCAAVEPPVPPPAAPPVARPAGPAAGPAPPAPPGVAVGNTASGGAIVSSGSHPAVVDSGPSAEALAVLATIPEPLTPEERVWPPGADSASVVEGVPAGGTGSPPAGETADSAQVPVPAPTEALGDRPEAFARALADTLSAIPPPAAPAARVEPDSCWRVQLAAPAGRREADLKREGAESVLLVPVVVEKEKRLYKLRTRDCMSREAAGQLRRRAIASGFRGAFAVVEVKR